jgi:hypothetical protein
MRRGAPDARGVDLRQTAPARRSPSGTVSVTAWRTHDV